MTPCSWLVVSKATRSWPKALASPSTLSEIWKSSGLHLYPFLLLNPSALNTFAEGFPCVLVESVSKQNVVFSLQLPPFRLTPVHLSLALIHPPHVLSFVPLSLPVVPTPSLGLLILPFSVFSLALPRNYSAFFCGSSFGDLKLMSSLLSHIYIYRGCGNSCGVASWYLRCMWRVFYVFVWSGVCMCLMYMEARGWG